MTTTAAHLVAATTKDDRWEVRQVRGVVPGRVVADIVASGDQVRPDELLEALADGLRTSHRLGGLAERLGVSPHDALAALEALADGVPAGAEDPASVLGNIEEQVLREAGSLRHELPPLSERASFRTVQRHLALLADALTVKEAAAALGVTEGRVRQRLGARTLFGIRSSSGWRLPRWQFGPDGLLRGLDRVLPAFPDDAYPAVIASFLQRPHEDLVLDDATVSPMVWLTAGGDGEVVERLAAGLHALP